MKAFTNTTMTKAELLKELRIHQKADDFMKGSYEERGEFGFKGCAVGCSLESLNRKKGTEYKLGDHSAYEIGFGVPRWLARMEDRIFEGLPAEEAMKWPVKFTSAINPGSDLNKVLMPCMAIICDSVLLTFDNHKYSGIANGIVLIAKLLRSKKATKQQLISARDDLRGESRAASADASAAAAAYAAAYASAAAAAAASAAASAAAAAAAARYKFYKFLAEELIKLIKECK